MKVGSDIEDDKRRSEIIRQEIGYDNKLVSFFPTRYHGITRVTG